MTRSAEEIDTSSFRRNQQRSCAQPGRLDFSTAKNFDLRTADTRETSAMGEIPGNRLLQSAPPALVRSRSTVEQEETGAAGDHLFCGSCPRSSPLGDLYSPTKSPAKSEGYFHHGYDVSPEGWVSIVKNVKRRMCPSPSRRPLDSSSHSGFDRFL